MQPKTISPAAQMQETLKQKDAQIKRLMDSLAETEKQLQASRAWSASWHEAAYDWRLKALEWESTWSKQESGRNQELLKNQSILLAQHRNDTNEVMPLWVQNARLRSVLEMVKGFVPFKECSCTPTRENDYAHWIKGVCGFHQIEKALETPFNPRVQTDPFVQFFAKAKVCFFDDERLEMDSDDFETWGEELGLLRQEPYDPQVHGDETEVEVGDMIYVLTDLAKEAMTDAQQTPTTEKRD